MPGTSADSGLHDNTDLLPKAKYDKMRSTFVVVTLCGLLNNYPYCVVSSMSQQLAQRFQEENQVTSFTTAMNLSCLLATFLSTGCLLGMGFYTRVRCVLAIQVIAYAGIALACVSTGLWGFIVVIFFAFFVGGVQTIGEITNLAFLKAFPPELVGAWGAGTGVAGILGGGITIIFTGIDHRIFFAMMIPTVFVYWAAFHYLQTEARRIGDEFSTAALTTETEAPRPKATPSNIALTFRTSGSILFNLVAVYCLEYFIYPGLDDRETACANKSSFKAWYSVMWMCYNIGVTASRLSVSLFRVQRVWIITLLQAINVAGWTIEVYTGVIRDSLPDQRGLMFMALWMILVGLCGGATYSNCMYLFNTQEGIPDELRELGISLGFLMSNVGIFASTFSFSFLDSTIMKLSIIYPNGCPE